MFAAAEDLRFEYAAKLRDEIKDLRHELDRTPGRATGRGSSQVQGECFRLVVELAPGDPDDAPAGGSERAIARTIAFEGRPGAVRAAAVELDDQALVRQTQSHSNP